MNGSDKTTVVPKSVNQSTVFTGMTVGHNARRPAQRKQLRASFRPSTFPLGHMSQTVYSAVSSQNF